MTLRNVLRGAAIAAAVSTAAIMAAARAQATTLQFFPADGSLDVTFSNIIGEQQIRLNVSPSIQFGCDAHPLMGAYNPYVTQTQCMIVSYEKSASMLNPGLDVPAGLPGQSVVYFNNYHTSHNNPIFANVTAENPIVHLQVPLGQDVDGYWLAYGNLTNIYPGYSIRFDYELTFDDSLQASIAEDELLPAPIPWGLPLLGSAILGLSFIGRMGRKAEL